LRKPNRGSRPDGRNSSPPQSQYVTSRTNYRRVIGVEPGNLAAGTPVDRLSPSVLAKAIAQGQAQSPSVLAAAYGADVAELAVRISEGALYPNLTVTGSVLQGQNPAFEVIRLTQLSAVAQLSVLIWRLRVFRDPSVQRDARPAAAQSRRQPRSGACDCGAKLGAA
jgi:outer membrane protein TolC